MTIPVLDTPCQICNARCLISDHYPRHFAVTCAAKRSYPTLEDACDRAGLHRSATPNGHVHVYRCPLADHWHVSTKRFWLGVQGVRRIS